MWGPAERGDGVVMNPRKECVGIGARNKVEGESGRWNHDGKVDKGRDRVVGE